MNANPFAARLADAAAATKGTARRDRLDTVEIVDGPAIHFTGPNTLSPAQEALIAKLLDERNVLAEDRPKYQARIAALSTPEQRAALTGGREGTASKFIEYLFTLPMQVSQVPSSTGTADVPEGRYAVDINGALWFVKIDRPTEGKWAGQTFIRRQLGSDMTRLNAGTRRRVLNSIAAQGIKECAIRYGHELGHCAMCGKELTNEASREAGIGPKCAAKSGW